MNEVVKRLIELCSYTWNDSYNVCSEGPEEPREFTFPQFLECITDYFERFSLNTSLTAEVRALLSLSLFPSLSLPPSLPPSPPPSLSLPNQNTSLIRTLPLTVLIPYIFRSSSI